MNLLQSISDKIFILDGATGTEIMKRLPSPFEFPEFINLEHEDILEDIHRAYIQAGAEIITTNTLGASRIKLNEYGAGDKTEKINFKAAEVARRARGNKNIFIAGAIGPTGKLIDPLGKLSQNEVYDTFFEQAKALEKGGVDLILIETQIDILEAKIAFMAARENTGLPIAVSMTFPLENGRTVTGTSPETAAITFSSTDLDILGINCGGDPREYNIWIKNIISHWHKPLIVYANAGVPEKKDNKMTFPLGPQEYFKHAEEFYHLGANIIGGCCGTSPQHIKYLSSRLKNKSPLKRRQLKSMFRASSRNSKLCIGTNNLFRVIGENINPFGRKQMNEELKKEKLGLVREYAREQEQAQADGLDINLGKKGESDPEFYAKAIDQIQNATHLPLFFDNCDQQSLELALRSYAGKAVINSINGKQDSYEILLPLAAKYGAAVILLALDKKGIPDTEKEKIRIIETLVNLALQSGLSEGDLLIDPVVLTISTSRQAAFETLNTIEKIKSLNLSTIMGLSNLSFGLPQRKILHAAFLPMAISKGLDAAIMNPLDKNLMSTVKACDAITGRDVGIREFISAFGHRPKIDITQETFETSDDQNKTMPRTMEENLFKAIIFGEKDEAEKITVKMLSSGKKGLDIFEDTMAPAIKQAGIYYEEKKYFLPQLILAAEAMERASTVLTEKLGSSLKQRIKAKIIMATVQGDFHDIGKNIITLILKNYGYDVIDLGKNVSKEKIINTAIREKAEIIGLSALMTSTMEEMKYVIELKNKKAPGVKIIVGGAAVTPSFAQKIGADAYGKQAIDTIRKVDALLIKD